MAAASRAGAAGSLAPGELRSLRAYAAANPGIPIGQDRAMFERLRNRGLVVGGIAYDALGDPFGVIKLTPRGRAVLNESGVP